MARLRKRGLLAIFVIVVVVILTGGYFAKRSSNQGVAAKRSPGNAVAADSVSDSTMAAADTTGEDKKGKKDKKDKDEKKEPDPVPIEVSLVAAREISSYYYTTATLEPERSVDVLTKIAGQVVRLHVEEGAVVVADAVLCELDDSELKIALDEARINMDQQAREFERVESMHKNQLVSDKEYSDAKYAYELAKNKFDAATVRYGYSKIRAPFGGVVTKRYIELGQNLGISTQVFQIVDPNPLLIRMYLPENEIADIKIGQKVAVEPDSDPGRTFYGRVVRIAPEVDERTGTIKVTAETNGDAVPGSFARVKIITETRQSELTIPRRGLISDAGELYVYVAEADTVRRSSVRVGYQDEDYAEVVSGVENGDSVVVVGTGGLRTGTKVKVLAPRMQSELTQDDTTEAKAETN